MHYYAKNSIVNNWSRRPKMLNALSPFIVSIFLSVFVLLIGAVILRVAIEKYVPEMRRGRMMNFMMALLTVIVAFLLYYFLRSLGF